MKISEMIETLQELQEEHGDLELYESDDAAIFKYQGEYKPLVCKIYSQKWEDAEWMKGQLSDGSLGTKDEDLYDVDLNKPIIKAVLL